MPTFVKASTGEAVRVEPSPHRSDFARSLTTTRSKRLRIYKVWWDYSRTGLSFRDIADFVGKTHSTVQGGIKAYQKHLDMLKATNGRPSSMEPAFGCTPYTPDSANQPTGDCKFCDNPIRYDSLVCPYCWGASESNEAALEDQRRREEGIRRKHEGNRAINGEPPAELVAKWDAIEAEQKAELKAKQAAAATSAA